MVSREMYLSSRELQKSTRFSMLERPHAHTGLFKQDMPKYWRAKDPDIVPPVTQGTTAGSPTQKEPSCI